MRGVKAGTRDLARVVEVRKTARLRLRWMDYYEAHGRNAWYMPLTSLTW
ncbi:MAG: hypothetical protein HY686_01420 [Chloroflexi bacterium]|nr:hypothetical protein [Chloroflexota bacterium]